MTPAAIVFDAYGTLFDVTAPARLPAGPHADMPRLSADWRRKQLEYTWARTLTGHHAAFDQVTADALDWAMEAQGLTPDTTLRRSLLSLYDRLPPFPEVPATLAALQSPGIPLAILSNGTPAMLETLTANAGLTGTFTALLSVEQARVFKPDPRVYAIATRRFACSPDRILFLSANGWDAAGAAAFGFRTILVNRSGLPTDRLPGQPAHIIPDLSPLPAMVRA